MRDGYIGRDDQLPTDMGLPADISLLNADVRFRTIADINGFCPEMACPLMTQRGH